MTKTALRVLAVLGLIGFGVMAIALPASPSYPNVAAQTSADTTEVLVLNALADGGTGGVPMPAVPLTHRRSVEIQNLGPNAIYCTLGGDDPVLTKSRKVDASGGTWAMDVSPTIAIECLAATADQVTGAATVVTEIR